MAIKTAAQEPARPARERLLAAANELFYAEGVHTVGIDRVIEKAGVAKASLYNTFGSKDELVRAYLQGRHARMTARITRHVEGRQAARAKLLAVFEAQAELFAEPEFRGCAFAMATAEAHSAVVDQAADDYRAWVRSLLTGLPRGGGAGRPTSSPPPRACPRAGPPPRRPPGRPGRRPRCCWTRPSPRASQAAPAGTQLAHRPISVGSSQDGECHDRHCRGPGPAVPAGRRR